MKNFSKFNSFFKNLLSKMNGKVISIEWNDLNELLFNHQELTDLPPGSCSVRYKKGLQDWGFVFELPIDCVDGFVSGLKARLEELGGEFVLYESNAVGGTFATHCPEIFLDERDRPMHEECHVYAIPPPMNLGKFAFIAMVTLAEFPLKRLRSVRDSIKRRASAFLFF